MINCPHCNKTLENQTKFCIHCGKLLQPDESPSSRTRPAPAAYDALVNQSASSIQDDGRTRPAPPAYEAARTRPASPAYETFRSQTDQIIDNAGEREDKAKKASDVKGQIDPEMKKRLSRALFSGANKPGRDGDNPLTPEDLINGLRAAAKGTPLENSLPSGDWEEYMAALLEILCKKHLVFFHEFAEALEKKKK